MRKKRDNLTLLLPFDQSFDQHFDQSANQAKQIAPSLADRLPLFRMRLAHYLTGRAAPNRLPMLKLLPSLNNTSIGLFTGQFSEEEAAKLLTQLGATIEINPHYLGRSKYRVTIPATLAEELIANR